MSPVMFSIIWNVDNSLEVPGSSALIEQAASSSGLGGGEAYWKTSLEVAGFSLVCKKLTSYSNNASWGIWVFLKWNLLLSMENIAEGIVPLFSFRLVLIKAPTTISVNAKINRQPLLRKIVVSIYHMLLWCDHTRPLENIYFYLIYENIRTKNLQTMFWFGGSIMSRPRNIV